MEKTIKQKKCKQCNKFFTPFRPLAFICSASCAIQYNNKKKEEKAESEWKERKAVLKEAIKTPGDYKKDLEVEINHIVRLIDKGHECISSNVQRYIVNAGHLYSVGAFPALRFNLLNIYAQSVQENKDRHGNGVIYKERIKEVFGIEVSEEIENLRILYPELKLSIPEIKEAIVKARSIVKSLKKIVEDEEKPFTTEMRIKLRRKLNDQLGIYTNENI